MPGENVVVEFVPKERPVDKLLVALIVLGGVCYAQDPFAPKGKLLPIVFDDPRNVEYVKNGCEMAASEISRGNPKAKPCPIASTPKDTVMDFEEELEGAFASESGCHGLSLIHATPAAAHWSWALDLDGHSQTQAGQNWSLSDPANHVLTGHITTPQRVVQQLCKIVKGSKPEKQ
jgi:hypothetical protein